MKVNGKQPHDAALLAAKYHISAKAVRDIWAHRTWACTTATFWTQEEASMYVQKRLCERCRDAGVRLGNAAVACGKCKHVVMKIVMRRKHASAHPTALAAQDNEHHSTIDAPMRKQAMDQIWRECNANMRGLLDETLDWMDGALK